MKIMGQGDFFLVWGENFVSAANFGVWAKILVEAKILGWGET